MCRLSGAGRVLLEAVTRAIILSKTERLSGKEALEHAVGRFIQN